MIEKSIEVERMEHVISVFGSFDQNLRIIENELGVKVLDRDDKIHICGEAEDVLLAEKAINGLLTLAAKGENIDAQNVRYILKLVKDGGYLATCSCSHFMTQELLAKTVKEAAKAVHKRLRQVEFRTQAADHPILWAADESYYLKFYIFQVVEEK